MQELKEYTDQTFADMHDPKNKYIGASMVPSIVLPPQLRAKWMPSPRALALQMLGQIEPDDVGSAAERGKALEPCTQYLLRQNGYEVTKLRHYWQLPDNDHYIASPDMMITMDDMSEFAETKAPMSFDIWADGCPVYTKVQSLWQMYVGCRQRVMVTATFVTQYQAPWIQMYPQVMDWNFLNRIIRRVDWFYNEVLAGRVPEVDDSESSFRATSRTIKLDDSTLDLTDDDDAMRRFADMAQSRADERAAKAIQAAAKQALLAAIVNTAERRNVDVYNTIRFGKHALILKRNKAGSFLMDIKTDFFGDTNGE